MAQFETGAVGTVNFEPGGVFFGTAQSRSRNAAAIDARAGQLSWLS